MTGDVSAPGQWFDGAESVSINEYRRVVAERDEAMRTAADVSGFLRGTLGLVPDSEDGNLWWRPSSGAPGDEPDEAGRTLHVLTRMYRDYDAAFGKLGAAEARADRCRGMLESARAEMLRGAVGRATIDIVRALAVLAEGEQPEGEAKADRLIGALRSTRHALADPSTPRADVAHIIDKALFADDDNYQPAAGVQGTTGQRQDSTSDQIESVRLLAVQSGCYDAADWIDRMRAQGTTETATGSMIDAVLPAEGERRDELIARIAPLFARGHGLKSEKERASIAIDRLREAAAPATPESESEGNDASPSVRLARWADADPSRFPSFDENWEGDAAWRCILWGCFSGGPGFAHRLATGYGATRDEALSAALGQAEGVRDAGH